ncbi:retropepsin-like aspartic protease family protein [Ohtaekwangia koreensis]|nr:retroviral-like aspartic protease family protein [Ohtaekwangia koreensis]
MIYKAIPLQNLYHTCMPIGILVLIVCSCAPVPLMKTESPVQSVNFYTVGRIPVVKAKLNGKNAFFIIDTGASVSILNESEAAHFGFSVVNYDVQAMTEVMSFNGTSNIGHVNTCILEIGSTAIKYHGFRSKDMREFASILQRDEQIRLAGILGSDLLNRYSMSINFMDKTISF